jgi:hypothetical protein
VLSVASLTQKQLSCHRQAINDVGVRNSLSKCEMNSEEARGDAWHEVGSTRIQRA